MKTPTPPEPGTAPPRNDFGPRLTPADVLAALDTLSRRQAVKTARYSSLTRLGRGGAA